MYVFIFYKLVWYNAIKYKQCNIGKETPCIAYCHKNYYLSLQDISKNININKNFRTSSGGYLLKYFSLKKLYNFEKENNNFANSSLILH